MAEDEVLVRRQGSLGRITLNRPRALNSLSIGMIRAMEAALAGFAADEAVAAVFVDGAGERGFCAGGDIRALHDQGRAGDLEATDNFWREEYALDAVTASYPKPYVAFMDGITMGGGVGISAHGAHRLVTERTKLAMPETGIGFFPDVGGTFLLPRAPGEVGIYLGLTGETIGAADAIYAGLADVQVKAEAREAIAEALAQVSPGTSNAELAGLLWDFADPPESAQVPPPPLSLERATIDRCFGHDTVREVFDALQADGSTFAAKTLKVLEEKSPTSLVLTLKLLRLGRETPTLQACLDREERAARQVMRGHEFYEGVRAALVDKDRRPRWNPPVISEVAEAAILKYTGG